MTTIDGDGTDSYAEPTINDRGSPFVIDAVTAAPDTSTRLMRLDEIDVGIRHRHDMGVIDELAQNIAQVGLLHPIVVTPTGQLIAGQRRILAFRKLGRDHIPATVIDLDQIAHGEYAENFFRKEFTPSEVVAIADAIEPQLRAEAKERQRKSQGRGQKGKGNSQTFSGAALDNVAKVVGKDRKTFTKARAVCEAANRDPAQFGKLKDEMDASGKVHGAFTKLQAIQKCTDRPTPKQNALLEQLQTKAKLLVRVLKAFAAADLLDEDPDEVLAALPEPKRAEAEHLWDEITHWLKRIRA